MSTLWVRATSISSKGSRSTVSSPPWGPVPVTIVPETITTAPVTTSARPSIRTRGGTSGRPGEPS